MNVATPEPVAPKPPPETIEGLFEALESPLLSYALRLLKDNEMAEDVVQEAFGRLHAQFAQVRERRAQNSDSDETLSAVERRHILKVFDACEGAVETTAARLGLSETVTRNRLKRYGRLTD